MYLFHYGSLIVCEILGCETGSINEHKCTTFYLQDLLFMHMHHKTEKNNWSSKRCKFVHLKYFFIVNHILILQSMITFQFVQNVSLKSLQICITNGLFPQLSFVILIPYCICIVQLVSLILLLTKSIVFISTVLIFFFTDLLF